MTARILIVGPDTRDSYLKPYKDAVRLAGGDPVRDWPTPEMIKSEKFLKVFLRLYGGVLLPGGTDIQPKLYGQEPLPKLGPTDRELDEGQLAIARMLIKHSIPTLAICRGLQVAAVAAGAALYQDLSSERPGVNHLISEPKDALAHGVDLVLDSRLAGLCGLPSFQVNSRHHQAVREGRTAGQVGPFRIAARAPDGVVEGMELPEHPFFVAVQWHPEDLVASHPPSRRLFEVFVAACRA